jgi:hypothetical protein
MQVKGGGQGPNYNPVRGQFAGIVNRQAGMFAGTRDPWEKVKAHLIAACRSDDEVKMNLPVAKQLYDFCVENNVQALELDAYPISFSVGPKLLCWAPALFIYKDKITNPFLDFRRSRKLTREAQRCIFSLQHHAIRVNNPDYAEVEFEVFQFNDNEERGIQPKGEKGRWLYSYEQLEEMISATQLLWFDVLAGREEEVRKTGTGLRGDLL